MKNKDDLPWEVRFCMAQVPEAEATRLYWVDQANDLTDDESDALQKAMKENSRLKAKIKELEK